MILSPQALRTHWPQTPDAFNRHFVRGTFEDTLADAVAEYQHGVATSPLTACNIPCTVEAAWLYITGLYDSLGVPHRTRWAEEHKNEHTFRLNFAALAAADYLQQTALFPALRWPKTFEEAVKLSRLRLRFVMSPEVGVYFMHPVRPQHSRHIQVWYMYNVDKVNVETWAVPQILVIAL